MVRSLPYFGARVRIGVSIAHLFQGSLDGANPERLLQARKRLLHALGRRASGVNRVVVHGSTLRPVPPPANSLACKFLRAASLANDVPRAGVANALSSRRYFAATDAAPPSELASGSAVLTKAHCCSPCGGHAAGSVIRSVRSSPRATGRTCRLAHRGIGIDHGVGEQVRAASGGGARSSKKRLTRVTDR